ncbi:hypothetical protein BDP27DRAFT_1366276 [Rhodocollybia butyracea]|uniref:Uncharacterized protein n=1 Tax=Rhodocollybia butyracea TaxID=206335 RepID=A0A9P5U3C8_9AGAR|nr:hypothetical protein BDP27DRAFT_1366276 [Rhodocollybia butyracea]
MPGITNPGSGRNNHGFLHSQGVSLMGFRFYPRRPFSITNMGLLVHFPLLSVIDRKSSITLALLNCHWRGTQKPLAIHVKKSDQHQYERVRSSMLENDVLAKYGKIEWSPQELLFRAWGSDQDGFTLQSHQVSFFFSGQGIRPVEQRSSSGAATKITNTTSMGVFDVYRHSPCTFLFKHGPSHQSFIVVAGIDGGNFWLDLLLGFKADKLNLNNVQQSYENDKCAEISRKALDRMSKFLTEDVAILIEARRRKAFNYMISICTVNKNNLTAFPIRTYEYAFHVSFSSVINAGFSLLKACPNCWEACADDTANLFLDNGSTSATLCFQHKQDRQRFAVTFGFRDKTTWSDVFFLKDTEYEETVEDICNSYRNNQKRTMRIKRANNGPTFLFASDTLDSHLGELTAMVSSRVLRGSYNQYRSEFEVIRGKKL